MKHIIIFLLVNMVIITNSRAQNNEETALQFIKDISEVEESNIVLFIDKYIKSDSSKSFSPEEIDFLKDIIVNCKNSINSNGGFENLSLIGYKDIKSLNIDEDSIILGQYEKDSIYFICTNDYVILFPIVVEDYKIKCIGFLNKGNSKVFLRVS